MAKKKSSFYHTRFNKVGINQEIAAQVLRVTVDDIAKWDDEGNHIAELALTYWDKKYVAFEGWNGFYFSRGALCYKKHRFTPMCLQSLYKDVERVDDLKRRLAELEASTRQISIGPGKTLIIPR